MGYYDTNGIWVHEEHDPATPGDGFSDLLNLIARSLNTSVAQLVADAIANDPDFLAAIEAAGALVASSGAGALIFRGTNDVDTWLQAARYVDPDSGVAPPTETAMRALQSMGTIRALLGSGALIIRASNDVDTWLQATGYLGRTGLAIPTPAAVEAMSQAGVVAHVDGPPPADLNLAPGEVRLYDNNGELTLAVGR